MKARDLPDVEVLREWLHLERATGQLFWRKCRCNGGRRKGLPAGSKSRLDGYLRVEIDGVKYLAHRVIWKLVTGRDPALGADIDHRNGNRADNRPDNLREASRAQNHQNRGAVSGAEPKGVYRQGDKFIAQIKIGGGPRYLGSFLNAPDAHAAYAAEAERHFGEFACPHGRPQRPPEWALRHVSDLTADADGVFG